MPDQWRGSKYPNVVRKTASVPEMDAALRCLGFPLLCDRSIRDFQRAAQITVDGILGGQTWMAALDAGSSHAS